MLFAAGSVSKNVQPLPRTVLKEPDVLNIAVPVAHVKLSKSGSAAFAMFSDAMKVVCKVYDTEFRQLTGSYEVEMEMVSSEMYNLSFLNRCALGGARQEKRAQNLLYPSRRILGIY